MFDIFSFGGKDRRLYRPFTVGMNINRENFGMGISTPYFLWALCNLRQTAFILFAPLHQSGFSSSLFSPPTQDISSFLFPVLGLDITDLFMSAL